MTDREKLVRTSNIENFIEERKYYIDRHVYSEEEKEGAYHILNCLEEWWEMFLNLGSYQPSGRACFDKPAGTAIEHWETL